MGDTPLVSFYLYIGYTFSLGKKKERNNRAFKEVKDNFDRVRDRWL